MTHRINRSRLILFRIAVVTMALLISFGIAEATLRVLGFTPFTHQFPPDEPVVLEFDPKFGWRSAEGRFQFSVLPGNPPIQVTVLPDGIRSSSPIPMTDSNDKPNIIIVGCSWMFGWGISDSDTLAWQLQKAFPAWQVVNYATGGYGTYQSLLRLEEAIPKMRPDVIVYGFILHHEDRNVASGYWLNALAQKSRRGLVQVPYVTIDQGRLQRHGLTQYPMLPGRKHLAVIAAIEKSWVELSAYTRTRQARQATELLLLDMKRLADKCNARFLVVFMGGYQSRPDIPQSYFDFSLANRIDFVDCSHTVDEAVRVPGDGHPNAKANARWFEAVEPAIRKLLAEKNGIETLTVTSPSAAHASSSRRRPPTLP